MTVSQRVRRGRIRGGKNLPKDKRAETMAGSADRNAHRRDATFEAAVGGEGTTTEATTGPLLPGPRAGPSGNQPQDRDPDLTRYLCATAYLKHRYANSLIRKIAADPHVAVAPAPACDVPVVLRHAYRANARRHYRDLVLCVFLLFIIALQVAGRHDLTALPLLLSWVVVMCYDLSTRYGVLKKFRRDTFRPEDAPVPPNDKIKQRLDDIGAYADGNMTVYSGYSPFIGFGTEVESWLLNFDTTVRDDSVTNQAATAARDVDVAELYANVAEHVGTVGLPGLQIEERLFVDGSALDDNRSLLSERDRPVPGIAPELMDELKREPKRDARPYLAVHCAGWEGELVASFFLRFVISGSTLFVEAVQTVLLPLSDRYRGVDNVGLHPTLRFLAGRILETPFSTILLLLAAPVRAVIGFDPDFPVSWRVRLRKRRINYLGTFDYGARMSARPQSADDEFRNHFQATDGYRFLKSIERRALDALIKFAEEHGMDTRDLKTQHDAIVNNGIIATGSARVESNSVASGTRARIGGRVRGKSGTAKRVRSTVGL
ncbi:zinc ribbon domain-containing protein [Streptomyces sp. NPDC001832]|uniref:zinc ribbon domain-containing protein n=1 Tax=Streptomyces sp. NPDC001832 TaxID=3154527 RepID=UPI0033164D47